MMCASNPVACWHDCDLPLPGPDCTEVDRAACSLLGRGHHSLTQCQTVVQMLKEYLGLEKVIWLWRGMEGDTEVVNGAPPSLGSGGTDCLTDVAVLGSQPASAPPQQ